MQMKKRKVRWTGFFGKSPTLGGGLPQETKTQMITRMPPGGRDGYFCVTPWLISVTCTCLFFVCFPSSLAADSPAGSWVNGITEAINDVTLSAPSAGIIGKRPVQEGDFVKVGQIVLELDKRLEELEVSRRKFVVDLKRTDVENSKKLFEKTISLSKEEMDKKIMEFSVADAEHELAKEVLNRRLIVAPFEGTVVGLSLNVGEACEAQQHLVRVVDIRKCYFICNIEARAGYTLRPGQNVKLEIEAGDKFAEFSGTVFFVSPVVDPASGLMRVKIVFDNPEGKIRPGVAGKMLLPEGKNA
jgi:RND family efflux transporter MFP subunit